MSSASVGFHCPSCVRESGQKVIRARDLGGPGRRPVTTALIVLNVAVYLVGRLVLIDGATVATRALLFGPLVVDGEWWRVVSAGFVHTGIVHLGLNMILLWMVGQRLESTVGSTATGLIYGAGLLGGSLATIVLAFDSASLGASAAVMGLAAATIPILAQRGQGLGDTPVLGLLAINLVLSVFSPSISPWGFVGGIGCGLAAGWLVANVGLRRRSTGGGLGLGAAAGLCALLFAASLALPPALGL